MCMFSSIGMMQFHQRTFSTFSHYFLGYGSSMYGNPYQSFMHGGPSMYLFLIVVARCLMCS